MKAKKRSGTKKQAGLLRSASRLPTWEAFLAKDGDADYHDLLRILHYKLQRMRFTITIEPRLKGAFQVGREIRAVERLLERVMDERGGYYRRHVVPVQRRLEGAYGRHRQGFEPSPSGHKTHVSYWGGRPEAELPRAARRRIEISMRKAGEQADKAREDDLKRAFAMMAEKIRGWWD